MFFYNRDQHNTNLMVVGDRILAMPCKPLALEIASCVVTAMNVCPLKWVVESGPCCTHNTLYSNNEASVMGEQTMKITHHNAL